VRYREWSDDWSTNDGSAVTTALPIVDIADTRPLPALIVDDSWLEAPSLTGGGDSFPQVGPRWRRAWLVLGAVLLGLAALVAIPLVGSRADRDTDPAQAGPSAGTPTDDPVASVGLVPAVGQAAQTTLPTATSAGLGVSHPAPPGFAPLTLQADTAQINRPARAIAYPGASDGSIVTNIGTWEHDNGTVQFVNVAIPVPGTYVITVYYVNLTDVTTSAEIAVSEVSLVTQTFTGNALCCVRVALYPMRIGAGTHTITIGNPNGPGPSIDKIVIALL
jgi:hypothetical protein